ncbi:MAG: DegT/DnrJ/EryC1/StrS family aminotransferase, partial [Anaerolineales bacterium]|nr:DegT/DnrJ/EryC1/StrS family aminotransferase [Anaerolineales bacterium]
PAEFGCDSRELLRALDRDGIQTRPLWQPIHLSPAHRAAGSLACPVAEHLSRQALSLPSSVGLCTADQDRVIQAVRESAGNA